MADKPSVEDNPKTPHNVSYYPERDGRDYITPEDVQSAIDAGATRVVLQQEVLEWLANKAAEDWGLCAYIAARFKTSKELGRT